MLSGIAMSAECFFIILARESPHDHDIVTP